MQHNHTDNTPTNSHITQGSAQTAAASKRRRSRQVPWQGRNLFSPVPDPEHPNGSHKLTISLCATKDSNFACVPASWGQIVRLASRHSERREKDGPAAIFAELVDTRDDAHVRGVSALAYEIDGKLLLHEIVRRLETSGLEAVLWTTHNHLRTSQTIGFETYKKWHRRKFGIDGLPTDEGVRQFCAENKRYEHLTNVGLAAGGKVRSVREYGRKVVVFDISHAPEHKVRIVFPLLTAIPINQPGGRSISDYKAIYHAHGRAIFGDAYSTESQNPSRLHYLPSYPPGRTGEVILFRGSLLDPDVIWQEILLAEEHSRASPEPSVRPIRTPSVSSAATESGELEYTLRHIPADLEYPDWFKCIAAIFHETRGSDTGVGLAHSWSSEDPRYDFNQVERIWDSLTLDHKNPVTIGTLVRLARQHNSQFKSYRPIRLTFLRNNLE